MARFRGPCPRKGVLSYLDWCPVFPHLVQRNCPARSFVQLFAQVGRMPFAGHRTLIIIAAPTFPYQSGSSLLLLRRSGKRSPGHPSSSINCSKFFCPPFLFGPLKGLTGLSFLFPCQSLYVFPIIFLYNHYRHNPGMPGAGHSLLSSLLPMLHDHSQSPGGIL